MNYLQVALNEGLDTEVAERYVYYMLSRWLDTESQKCADGYAREWALRFKSGQEFECSDIHGRSLLYQAFNSIYGKHKKYMDEAIDATFNELF